jgi:hypothetical protein
MFKVSEPSEESMYGAIQSIIDRHVANIECARKLVQRPDSEEGGISERGRNDF